MKIPCSLILALFFFVPGWAQTLLRPGYAFCSHETMELLGINNSGEEFKMEFRLKSYLEGSEFCMDKKTYLFLPSGLKLYLRDAKGIPQCPKTHAFKTFGETVDFSLSFAKIPEGTICIDLIEDCDENCVRVIGIITDTNIDREYKSCMQWYREGNSGAAISGFLSLLEKLSDNTLSIRSSIYAQIIFLLYESGKPDEAREWMARMKKESPPYTREILLDLEKRGLRFQ